MMAKLKEGVYIACYDTPSGYNIGTHSLIFTVSRNFYGKVRVWFSWLGTTHCVDNGKPSKVLDRINDIAEVGYEVVVSLHGLEVQQ